MRLRRGTAREPLSAWPGYVDALSTLLIIVIFVLLVLGLAQGFLSAALSGREDALAALNRRVAALTEALALERREAASLEARRAALARALADSEAARGAEVAALAAEIERLRGDLARVARLLGEERDRVAAREREIADLGARLNAALVERVETLERYRSDFFGRLREVLGERPDIRIAGDRFVFQAEVLFPPGSAELSAAGEARIRDLARTLLDLSRRIPPDVPWLLRVDGHADRTPIRGGGRFASNWDLSAARAIAVVQVLVAAGLPPERVAAAAFGEFQPVDAGDSPEALARNRRIEFRLTDR
jgi:chemotaxis protein MotB